MREYDEREKRACIYIHVHVYMVVVHVYMVVVHVYMVVVHVM